MARHPSRTFVRNPPPSKGSRNLAGRITRPLESRECSYSPKNTSLPSAPLRATVRPRTPPVNPRAPSASTGPALGASVRVMIPAMALRDGAREEDDVALLFREEYRSLVRLAHLLVHDRGVAEELVQEAFVKLLVGRASLRDPARAPAWLRSAVLNGARSRLRHLDVRRRHEP